jgi:hypothetical protein
MHVTLSRLEAVEEVRLVDRASVPSCAPRKSRHAALVRAGLHRRSLPFPTEGVRDSPDSAVRDGRAGAEREALGHGADEAGHHTAAGTLGGGGGGGGCGVGAHWGASVRG